MKKTSYLPVIAILSTLLYSASQMQAAVLINTGLDGTTNSTLTSTNGNGKAVAFTSGTDLYSLDSVSVRLTYTEGTAVPDPVFAIFSNATPSAGEIRPSALLVTLSLSSALTSGNNNYILTPDSSFSFAANTTYWLALMNTVDVGTGGSFGWLGTAGGDSTSGGFTLPVDISSSTSGIQYGVFKNTGDTTTNPSTYSGFSGLRNDFQINGTLVPEPSTALLSLIAVAGLSMRRRR